MSGTPEKILEHLLETIKLESNGNDAIGDTVKITDACFLLLKKKCSDQVSYFVITVLW